MRKQKLPGLRLRDGIWHIDKRFKYFSGGRLRESTGINQKDYEKAEAYLMAKMEAARNAVIYGVRPDVFFKAAAAKYLLENTHKASIQDDALHLKQLMPFIGHLQLSEVHNDALKSFVDARKQQGIKSKSINLALSVVRRILNLSARLWRHNLANGRSVTWLETPPLILMLTVNDAARPYPLNWDEQRKLFSVFPKHLAEMGLFKVNTGTREQEVCRLQWSWELPVKELNTSVFVVPRHLVKNREDRLIVLNKTAKSVIEARRDIHSTFVFTYRGKPVTKMNNTAWKNGWRKAGLPVCAEYLRGVHNLKHTFGRRLRAANVSFETRQVLLGHSNGSITTHYSAAELTELLEATEKICFSSAHVMPTLTMLKQQRATVR